MTAKKQNFLEKIVKKDYNNELEKILEEKDFSENAKSALLSILYKIEASYKDVETVKKDIETKEEYIENQKMATYHTLQRDFLWQSVKNENEDEILFLTKQKDISYQNAIQSFYDEYTDKLIQQAKIQYLDTSICEFMKDYH